MRAKGRRHCYMIADRRGNTSPGFRSIAGNRLGPLSTIESLGISEELWHRQLEAWSDGGLGMNISGNVQVDRRYLEAPRNVSLEKDTPLEPSQNFMASFEFERFLKFVIMSM